MAIYDFKNLSPYDFEILTKDLLEKELQLSFENFKSGRDQGIDLRYSSNYDNIIIQCKHYANSTFSNLKSSLKKELVKLPKLAPSRYIISTSLGLTPNNKSELVKLMKPYILNSADIIDSESLNSFLRKYPKVEKNHYKLWLSSTGVLEKIFNSLIANKSDIKRDKIAKQIRLYVECRNFYIALEILKGNNYCIISGEPGIGKTTLAQILSYKYIDKDFTFYEIANIGEAYKSLKPDEAQVFYYDDFLGSTSYIDKEEDNDLMTFIEHIQKTKNKKLIMTTREYIYKQAKINSERFNRCNFEKCIIKQSDYHQISKAKILYNHLYFSEIGEEYYNQIIENKNYNAIINHRNYSPRIIEWMTNTFNFSTIKPENYYNVFISNLDNPEEIWRYAYENYISDTSQYILMILIIIGNQIQYENLKMLLKNWKDKENRIPIIKFTKQFNDSLIELENTFIKIEQRKDQKTITYQNPSIKDFLEFFLNKNLDILKDYYTQSIRLWDQKLNFLLSSLSTKKENTSNIMKLTKKYVSSIITESIDNFSIPSLTLSATTNNYYNKYANNYSRIHLQISILAKFNSELYYSENMKKILNIFNNLLEKESFIKYQVFLIFRQIPVLFFSDFYKEKLNSFYHSTTNIEELSYLVQLSERNDFIKIEENIDDQLEETFENIDYELDDLSDLNELKDHIDNVCCFFDISEPDSYSEIESIIQEIEEQEAHAEDMYAEQELENYREMDFKRNNTNNEVDNIFDSLLL